MVDYPIVRFVGAPGVKDVWRLDLNDGVTWTTDHDGFSLGAPEYDVDPYAVGALYGLRDVTLTPRIKGGPAVAFPELSKLSVELMRQRNWLLFQYDADSAPFWLRVYRTATQPLDLEDVYIDRDSSEWSKPITLKADPFARGEKVTLPAITIANNPAAATGNKVSYTLPAIEGDAPAPLEVLLDGTTTPVDLFKAPMVSTSAAEEGSVYPPPLLVTDWSFVSTKTTDSAYVAGGYYAVPNSTEASEGWAAVTPPFAGRYKAYLRAGFSDAGSEFDLDCGGGRVRVTQRAIGNDASEPWIWWGAVGSQGWIDMGVVTLGRGWNPVLNPTKETTVKLLIQRLNGTGKIRVDSLLFVPIDGTSNDNEYAVEARTLKVDPLVLPSSVTGVKFHLDSEHRQTWAAYEDTGLLPGEVGGLSGRFPQVIPGRTNYLHLLRNVDTGGDVKGNNTTVTLSYFPRRLDPLGL